MISLDYAGVSDVGRVRRENQDRWFADPEQGLFLVADGMGGTMGGKVAADIVAEILPPLIRQRLQPTASVADKNSLHRVVDALAEMSERLNSEARQRFGRNRLGSTVVLVLIRQNQALVTHLGDSRAYICHRGRLRRLTRDHNLAQTLVDSGALPRHEACNHPTRSQLTRFVGMEGNASPEAQLVPIAPGDRLLLCTDGLYGLVAEKRLEAILLRSPASSSNACRELILAAQEAGGTDNITAVVIVVRG